MTLNVYKGDNRVAEEKKTTVTKKAVAKKPATKKKTSTAKKTTASKTVTAKKTTTATTKKTTTPAKKPADKKSTVTKTAAAKVSANVQKIAQDKTEKNHMEYDQKGSSAIASDQTPQVDYHTGFWSWWKSLGLGISGNVIVVLIILGIIYEIIKRL